MNILWCCLFRNPWLVYDLLLQIERTLYEQLGTHIKVRQQGIWCKTNCLALLVALSNQLVLENKEVLFMLNKHFLPLVFFRPTAAGVLTCIQFAVSSNLLNTDFGWFRQISAGSSETNAISVESIGNDILVDAFGIQLL